MSPVDPAELRAAVDEVAIRGLIAAYADVVDRRTWTELADLFLPGAPVVLDLRDRPPELVAEAMLHRPLPPA